jgi:hypothetical protein
VERVGVEVDRPQFGLGKLDLLGVGAVVEAGVDLKPSAVGGRTDEADDRLQRYEWLTASSS